jgi:hypothetical protein
MTALVAILWTTSPARAEERAPPVVVERSAPAVPDRTAIETDAARLTPGLVLQLDAANAGARPGFSMHRARISLDAEVERLQGLGAFVQLGAGAADSPSPLLDAFVRFRVVGRGGPDLGELHLGQRKVPVSREAMRDPAELSFVDRAPAAVLAPSRDLGVLWHLALARGRRRFGVDLGVWNGEGAGAPASGGTTTTLRLAAGAGDPGRATPGMDWGFGYASSADAPSEEGPGAQAVLSVDGEIRYRALTAGAETIWKAHRFAGDARGFFGWVGWQLVADTLELRARGEVLDDGTPERALTFGLTFFYLAPRLRLLVDHTVGLTPGATNDDRTVTSFLFVL